MKSGVNFYTHEIGVSFVQNEILELARHFNTVNVFTFKIADGVEFPENVIVSKIDYSGYSTGKVLKSDFFLIAYVILSELIKAPKYFYNISRLKSAVSDFMRCVYLAQKIKNKINQESEINYTFWFNQWATVLSVLKRGGYIKDFFSRTHGTDLYEHRVPVMKRIPFRWFQMKYVTKVFSVSKNGEQYLKEKYPDCADKIDCIYLGTKDNGIGKADSDSVFTVLSCANVRNIKRIHLIPSILEKVKMPIKWIHVGNENAHLNNEAVKQYMINKSGLIKSGNCKVVALGAISNDAVIELYKNEPIHLFISVSETEGLPVSMMEAISFGVPILATDVGGCKEIVTDKTGVLIPSDFTLQYAAEKIEMFMDPAWKKEETRINARDFWSQNFNGEVNFKMFLKKIGAN